MKVTFRLLCVYVFVCLFSESTTVTAQRYHPSSLRDKIDTVYIFSDRLKLLLRGGAYDALTSDILTQEYVHQFGVGDVQQAYGFAIQKKDTLRFYQTSLDRPLVNDGSFSIWKMIDSIVFKMQESQWLESGWHNLGNDYLYFVKLVSAKKVFFEFNFFFLDEKLTFSVFHRSAQDLYFNKPENYLVDYLLL